MKILPVERQMIKKVSREQCAAYVKNK